jgi:hypothetical protein
MYSNVFDRIHYLGRIHCSFGWFIGKIGRYSSVEDFTIHIFNQMDFSRFLPNSTDFFQKPTGSEGPDFLVSTDFLNTGCDCSWGAGERWGDWIKRKLPTLTMSGEEDGNRLDSDGGRPVSILYRPISDYGVMKLHLGLKNKMYHNHFTL